MNMVEKKRKGNLKMGMRMVILGFCYVVLLVGEVVVLLMWVILVIVLYVCC